MKSTFRMIALLCAICLTQMGISQKDWETSLKDKLYQINWLKQANDGTVLVGGDKAMAGLDPISGEVIWINENLKAVEMSTVSMIEQLPYFVAKTQNLLGKESLQVVNATDGQTLMDSKSEDISIMDYKLYQSDNAILFQIKKDKRYELVWYDLVTTSPLWSLDIDKAKGGLGGLLKGKTSFLSGDPVTINNIMVVAYKKSIIGIDLKSGAKVWTKEYDDDIKTIVVNEEDNQLFVGVDKYMDLVTTNDGKSQLSEPIKLKDKLLGIQKSGDEIIVMHKKGMNIYDSKTQSLRWKKPDYPGQSDQVIKSDKGYITISKYEQEGKITLLDKNGKKKWDKGVSGRVIFVSAVSKGVFYISGEKSNILNYTKGDKVSKDDVKIKGNPAVAFDQDDNKVVIFSDKKLTTFDIKKGTSKEIAKDIKFEKFNDSEDWASIDVRESGYFISSSQNVALVSKTGKVKFNNHYKPVSASRAFGALTAMASTIGGVNVGGAISDLNRMDRMMSGSFKDASSDGADERTKSNGLYVGGAPVFGISNTRYMATKEDKDFVYIFMKAKKDKQVVKVNKDTGKTVSTVRMKDKSPIYLIDDYEQTIITVESGKSVKCHDTLKQK